MSDLPSAPRLHPPGRLIVVDAEGALVPAATQDVTGMTVDEVKLIQANIQSKLGDGCYVVFREA